MKTIQMAIAVFVAVIFVFVVQSCKHDTVGDPNELTVKCDASQFRFSIAIQPLMNKYCVGCHSYPNGSANIERLTYQGVKTSIAKWLMPSLLLYGVLQNAERG